MKKYLLLSLLIACILINASAADYGKYRQWAEINFENATTQDALSNVSSKPMNGASIIQDMERQGKVLRFSAESKGCLQLDTDPLSNQMTLSFWGKREDTYPSAAWRMFLAMYAADGSNIFLTPRTTWNENSYLILESKDYSSYKSIPGIPIVNEKWYHFALVFQNYTIQYYINGNLQVELTSLFQLSDFKLNKFYFGCNPELNYPMTGCVDDIQIYHSALAANQVQALYKGNEIPAPEKEDNPAVSLAQSYTIHMNNKHQTLENFGASDGWNVQPVGLYAPLEKKEALAKLLFSTDTLSDGTPDGIGMSSWRFNIGAGTYEQGNASRISFYSRRTECFLNPDKTTYDWNKQAGQRWFLEKAVKNYQVRDIIGWQNSPPVYYTVRGLGFREFGDAKMSILKASHYEDFGRFLADVVLHFKEQGIPFKYISPLNEPQWDWCPTATGGIQQQEGTPWTNTEISDVVKAIDKVFKSKNIDTKLFITEAGSINYLLKNSTGHAANQLERFWDPKNELTLAGLPSFSNHVSAHSYFTDATAEDIIQKRLSLKQQIKETDPSLDYWQTEYCLLGNGYKLGHPNGSNRTLTPMECAVSMARIIHADLVVGNCTAWQWWTSMEFDSKAGTEERYALIRYELNKSNNDVAYRPTKLLYALGNFSRFIRPGMKRIDVTSKNGMTPVEAITKQMVSAYVDEQSKELVVVAINVSKESTPLNFQLNGLSGNQSVLFTPYVTTDDPSDNLRRDTDILSDKTYLLPPTSVVTFVGKIREKFVSIPEVETKTLQIYPNPAHHFVQVKSTELIRQITLRDTTGHTVLNVYPKKTNEYTLSTSDLRLGMYLISVESTHDKQSTKLLVRK